MTKISAAVSFLVVMGCISKTLREEPPRSPSSETIGAANKIEVPEGLQGHDLADFEHLSEGADFFPYDWFIALESATVPGKKFQVGLDQTSGLVPSKNLKTNKEGRKVDYLVPYVGLSVAWSDHRPERSDAFKQDPEILREIGEGANTVKSVRMLGTNCALCHSGALSSEGKIFKIDGGPTHANVRSFFKGMIGSTIATLADQKKLEAFLQTIKGNSVNSPPSSNPADQKARANLASMNPSAEAEKLHKEFMGHLGGEVGAKFKLGLAKGILGLPQTNSFLFPTREKIGKSFESLLRVTSGIGPSEDIGVLKLRMEFLGNLAVGTDPQLKETPSGYGRTDAFGRISNLVLRGNYPTDYTAPVSLPWIWGIKYMAMIHYNSNSNSVSLRNVGQAMGLGAILTPTEASRFESTVNLYNLNRLEGLVHKIQVPRWTKVFKDEIAAQKKGFYIESDVERASWYSTGKQIYEKKCQSCHESNNFVGPTRGLRQYNIYALQDVGTDRYAAANAVKPVKYDLPKGGTEMVPFENSIYEGVAAIKSAYYRKYNVPEAEQARIEYRDLRGNEFFRDTLKGFQRQNDFGNNYGNIEFGSGYKARHLAGVWATAPFLHNGSVPTLMDLLSPAHQRPRSFNYSHMEFDPIKVGLKNYERPKDRYGRELPCSHEEYKKDTCFSVVREGNSNQGHEYGTDLDQESKIALINYLKVLPPEPEYSW